MIFSVIEAFLTILPNMALTERLCAQALWQSRTDHFVAAVTYLQFPMQVCFSSRSASQPVLRRIPGFLNLTFTFSRERNTFPFLTLNFDL